MRATRLALGAAGCALALLADAAAARGVVPRDLFVAPGIHGVSVSPSGDWIVATGTDAGRSGIFVQRRGDGVNVPVYASKHAIYGVTWLDADTVFVRHPYDEHVKAVVLRFSWDGRTVHHDLLEIRKSGELIDVLRDEPGSLLWATGTWEESTVHRRSVESLGRWKRGRRGDPGEVDEVASLRHLAEAWVTDRDGVVRAALVVEGFPDTSRSLQYRDGPNAGWSEVWSGGADEEYPHPVAMTPDGERLVVVARGERDTRGIYELDPETGELGAAIFVHPDVDVEDVRLDPSGSELVAAVYEEGGDQRVFYLDAFRDEHLKRIDELGLGDGVMVTSASRDYQFLTLLVRGPREPGTYYFLDQKTAALTKIGDANLKVRPELLAETIVLPATSGDGTELEAFLTIPLGVPKPFPLLVLPHGGPIGVQDSRSFDPMSQFVALEGIGVLKVNYRGSGGRGRKFEESGKREWGRAIEDDVDAAVREAIGRGFADPKRMCIAGGSYGGYSALMSAIRWPDRYKCVTTIAGVTDLPLLFTQSDLSWFRPLQREMKRIVGDPATEYERLVEVSPVYHVDALRAPVLIIHGKRDRRVDLEHAHRLRAMLELYDKPYKWVEFERAGHGFDAGEWHRVSLQLVNFVKRSLDDRPGA